MKKLTLALAVVCLGSSFSVNAALFTGNDQHTVSVPALTGGFQGSITGTYMDLSYPRTNYALTENLMGLSFSGEPSANLEDVDHDWEFGFGVMLGWVLDNSGNDLRLNYFYTKFDDCDSKTREDDHVLWTNTGLSDDDYIEFADKATADIEVDTYNVDFEVGQFINVGCRLSMRFHGGLSYSHVEQDSKIHYYGAESVPSNQDAGKMIEAKLDSEFNGIGPRVGMDTDLALGYGFGFVTRLATALYVGQVDGKSRAEEVNNLKGEEAGEIVRVSFDDKCHVVPNLDLKIGLDYTYQFSGGTVASIEGGYWVKHYFDALSHIDFTDQNHDQNHTIHYDDVTFNGVYLTLKVDV